MSSFKDLGKPPETKIEDVRKFEFCFSFMKIIWNHFYSTLNVSKRLVISSIGSGSNY